MDIVKIKRRLDEIILTDIVDISEYQDKFYFVKSLTEEFLGVPEKVFYLALEKTNNLLEPPRKKKKFIEVFLEGIVADKLQKS